MPKMTRSQRFWAWFLQMKRKERGLLPVEDDINIIFGDGWTREGLRTFEYNTSVAVNPALEIVGVVPGATYAVTFNCSIFTGTGGQCIARLGWDLTGNDLLMFNAVGTYSAAAKCGPDNDKLRFIIDTNATVTRLSIKDLFVRRL